MKKFLLFTTLLLFISLLYIPCTHAQKKVPDTVVAGIYVTSINEIDFKQKQYMATFWLWLKYRNKALDFVQNLEVPQAKNVTRSFLTIDSSNNRMYLLMKMQCLMNDSWKINNFPFDRQVLRLSIENSQFDSSQMIFVIDKAGKQFDPQYTIRGWNIDSFTVSTGKRTYESAFGDDSMVKPHTVYSVFKVRAVIKRDAMGLFWKMFLGMYVAFLIAYVCFYIHADGIDSRFGLSVGALFAVIGNKYIIDSSLPESSSFTLVDILHQITLIFILTTITATAYSIKLVKQKKIIQARRFDMIAAQVLLAVYLILNIYFIWQAI